MLEGLEGMHLMDNRTLPEHAVGAEPEEDKLRPAEDDKLERLIDEFNLLHRKHGLISDEFSDF